MFFISKDNLFDVYFTMQESKKEYNSGTTSPMGKKKGEAHRPQLDHRSEIATVDMQMLGNIFPILSLQLKKGSSFQQF